MSVSWLVLKKQNPLKARETRIQQPKLSTKQNTQNAKPEQNMLERNQNLNQHAAKNCTYVCISLCTPVVHGTVQNSDCPPNLQESSLISSANLNSQPVASII